MTTDIWWASPLWVQSTFLCMHTKTRPKNTLAQGDGIPILGAPFYFKKSYRKKGSLSASMPKLPLAVGGT